MTGTDAANAEARAIRDEAHTHIAIATEMFHKAGGVFVTPESLLERDGGESLYSLREAAVGQLCRAQQANTIEAAREALYAAREACEVLSGLMFEALHRIDFERRTP